MRQLSGDEWQLAIVRALAAYNEASRTDDDAQLLQVVKEIIWLEDHIPVYEQTKKEWPLIQIGQGPKGFLEFRINEAAISRLHPDDASRLLDCLAGILEKKRVGS